MPFLLRLRSKMSSHPSTHRQSPEPTLLDSRTGTPLPSEGNPRGAPRLEEIELGAAISNRSSL